ncbi:L-saccharopine oxidase [Pseudocercospora fuligena]|uniref:L-saccharopine oxidase n=1 Tax=Pseudocercospora fuligena TaxID=685502 RepID=A0A8H6RH27_9PEZI|nr:L-saccharopine oxidase [Pseudocercospora fuligena]
MESAGKTSKDDKIIIVGAGIFGLSTAIDLARRGYQNVTVFDRQPYDASQYSYFKGADAASADINKIVRSAYGGVSIYQDLTLEAIEGWKAWNAEIASGESVSSGMKGSDRVFIPNGNLIMTDAEVLPDFDQATVDSMEAAGHTDTQLVMSDPRHCQIAEARGLGFAIDPFRRKQRGKSNVAVLDSTGGTAVADKACRFALYKARMLGVKFVLGPSSGAMKAFQFQTGSKGQVCGISTLDGKVHNAALVVMACGGWTPSLVPQLDGLCETTAGSVALIRIPRDSSLWERFAPENFPSWVYKVRDGAEGGLYGFARDDEGWLKIGYRGTKYTNPITQADAKERSVPVTRWSSAVPDGARLTAIPQQAFKVIQGFLDEHLPELAAEGLGIDKTRICWYNDSYDNHLVIDWVPNVEGLMVATGGSGHAFKYLPVIGKYVVDVIEGRGLERASIKAWRWRQLDKNETAANVLMEGSTGARAINNIPLVEESDLSRQDLKAKL